MAKDDSRDAPLDPRIEDAERLRQAGEYDAALRACQAVLNEDFDNFGALYMSGHILIDAGRFGLAHALYRRLLELRPNVSGVWTNLSRCYQEIQDLNKTEECVRKALKIDPNDSAALANLGLCHLNRCDMDNVIAVSRKALLGEPTMMNAKYNMALAYLAKHEWAKGWELYETTVGHLKDRTERVYGNEGRWDGTPGKRVAVYGEQGIGDEVSFASMIPDAAKMCSKMFFECDERLAGLFARSFPDVEVRGTRFKSGNEWPDTANIEARSALASLGKYVRQKDEDFTGKPYLVADPERRLQWRALFDHVGQKPRVGIAWSGGIMRTGKSWRSLSLESMLPILKHDCTWISLQYRDCKKDELDAFHVKHGIRIHHWARGSEARDYDETAAMVAELDLVISVTTAVIHLAGGLGVPCWVLTPRYPLWRYGLSGEAFPWAKSVRLVRQRTGKWDDVVYQIAHELGGWLADFRRIPRAEPRAA